MSRWKLISALARLEAIMLKARNSHFVAMQTCNSFLELESLDYPSKKLLILSPFLANALCMALESFLLVFALTFFKCTQTLTLLFFLGTMSIEDNQSL